MKNNKEIFWVLIAVFLSIFISGVFWAKLVPPILLKVGKNETPAKLQDKPSVKNISPLTPIKTHSREYTVEDTAYIFSHTTDKDLFGEGFFIISPDGDEIFIYSSGFDNPRDMAEVKRFITAAINGAGTFNLPSEIEIADIYILAKSDLEVDHMLLNEEGYRVAAEKTREIGSKKNPIMVYYRSIVFTENEMRFSCKDISYIDNITVTTRGSTYYITINMNNGAPLNIGISTEVEKSHEILSSFTQEIDSIIGSDKIIIAKNAQYQNEIFTIDGTRTGWLASIDNIYIE